MEPDLFTAAQARDEAIDRVTENAQPWTDRARDAIDALCNWEGTGEDLRLLIEPRIGLPHHHNAWGGVIIGAIRRGALIDTGRMVRMRTTKSHARKTTVYMSRN